MSSKFVSFLFSHLKKLLRRHGYFVLALPVDASITLFNWISLQCNMKSSCYRPNHFNIIDVYTQRNVETPIISMAFCAPFLNEIPECHPQCIMPYRSHSSYASVCISAENLPSIIAFCDRCNHGIILYKYDGTLTRIIVGKLVKKVYLKLNIPQ